MGTWQDISLILLFPPGIAQLEGATGSSWINTLKGMSSRARPHETDNQGAEAGAWIWARQLLRWRVRVWLFLTCSMPRGPHLVVLTSLNFFTDTGREAATIEGSCRDVGSPF